ncbi:MipA/OmpV family protein [Salipiger mucosus]|uniref:MltA-interacting MipA n=1 Tax=Salipiger mucosus DSM 16094 TaxID=1123237 RepID=S9RN99_9RHOB|nr:MipA/OmpV family protein [Salipiger mucosus]EPX79555.1 hypothetical protein Salmuc_05495 [Salipiger mucosus DSM 16094]
MLSTRLALPLTLAAGLSAAPALAQEEPAFSTQSGGGALAFTLRGGVSVSPEYFGSDSYAPGPDVGFRFNNLRLRNGREFGNPDPWADSLGWGVHGSFRYIGERDASDFSDLQGLDDVDQALELGVGVGYTARNFEAFADVRRGFGGHEAWVGAAGIDGIMRPNDRLRLSLGPRLLWGSEDYTETYFGVSPSEAGPLPAYDPSGGLVSAGVEFGARYQINDDWGVEGAVSWETFTGDAENSPIVERGDADQWKMRIGVTRTFRLRF